MRCSYCFLKGGDCPPSDLAGCIARVEFIGRWLFGYEAMNTRRGAAHG